MATLCVSVASGIVVMMLFLGCAAHLTRPSLLADALRSHRVLPVGVTGAVARAVPAVEGLLGLLALAALLAGHRVALLVALGLSAFLFAGYAGYSRYAVSLGAGGACGCARTEVPMSDWVVGRAVVLTLLAGGGALLAGSSVSAPAGFGEWATVTLATLTFTGLLWTLPVAMYHPAQGGTPSWTS